MNLASLIARSATPESRAAWQGIIRDRLEPWLRDPDQLADEGVTPPTQAILRLAIDLAEKFRDECRPAPSSVVASPNGGVAFEWRSGDDSEVVDVWDDGLIEYMRFEGTRLIERKPL